MYPFCFGDCSEGRRDLPGEHMCGRGRGSAGLRGSANTNIQEQELQKGLACYCKPCYNGIKPMPRLLNQRGIKQCVAASAEES